jgi:hypothetical protein
LCLALKWSWADLQGTPPYVRRVFGDLLAIRRRVMAAKGIPPGE